MSDTSSAIARLKALVGEIVDLRHAASLIGWDEWYGLSSVARA